MRANIEPLHGQTDWLTFHHVVDRDSGGQLGARMVHRIALVLHGHERYVLLTDIVDRHQRLISSANIHRSVTPRGLSKRVVEDAPECVLWARMERGHLFFSHDKTGIKEPRCNVPPASHWHEDTGPPAHVHPAVRPVRPSSPVHEVFSLHVNPIGGVGGRAQDDGLHILDFHPS